MPENKKEKKPLVITSHNNSKIKEVLSLLKTRNRKKAGLVAVEGRKEIETAKASGARLLSLFFCPAFGATVETASRFKADETQEVAEGVFKKISYRQNPDGWLGLVEPICWEKRDIKIKENMLVIAVESLANPGNLGAIARTGAAAGVDLMIVCDPKTDIYHPNAIYSSRGAVFALPIMITGTASAIKWLMEKKIRIFAATPQADMRYTEADYSGGVAIVIGTEHEGLSQDWLKGADETIRIPLAGKVDSLNASVSAAVIIFEAVRQRENNAKIKKQKSK